MSFSLLSHVKDSVPSKSYCQWISSSHGFDLDISNMCVYIYKNIKIYISSEYDSFSFLIFSAAVPCCPFQNLLLN